MTPEIIKDRLSTHAVTNYLLAGYQGKFTFLNILSQLQYPGLDPALITFTRQALDKIAFWTEALWNDHHLFAAQWTAPQTFDSRQALELLDQLKPDLLGISGEIARIFSLQNPAEKFQDIAFLCAAFGRFSYARENYIKGFIEFATKFNSPQDGARYSAMLAPAQDDVRLTHTIINLARDLQASSTQDFLRNLYERSIPLIAVFRTHTHDISQILAQYRGGLSFDKADFNVQEATAWSDAGIGPVAAGYWRANGFSPVETPEWVRYGFSNPGVAASWRTEGFNPASAQPWAQSNMPPVISRLWAQAGYDTDETKEMIDSGVTDPRRAPRKEK